MRFYWVENDYRFEGTYTEDKGTVTMNVNQDNHKGTVIMERWHDGAWLQLDITECKLNGTMWVGI